MKELTAFQRDILYVVASLGSPKGLAIKERLDEYYESEVNHGRLYPNLDHLVDGGLLEKGSLDDRTNSYTLTADAMGQLKARREWERKYVE